ncbi:unnamed protein product [Cyprideis torosa]|uniref:Uncharacterized protein n=1 Tax=Cyprideis torosa TaxID=163714 RepID=A0A7R8WLM5_9CRUS|nr:unnamed protein product [Cyprideis torosa]CAG0898367.1 unnamed protein product [Cyprideis torosa]
MYDAIPGGVLSLRMRHVPFVQFEIKVKGGCGRSRKSDDRILEDTLVTYLSLVPRGVANSSGPYLSHFVGFYWTLPIIQRIKRTETKDPQSTPEKWHLQMDQEERRRRMEFNAFNSECVSTTKDSLSGASSSGTTFSSTVGWGGPSIRGDGIPAKVLNFHAHVRPPESRDNGALSLGAGTNTRIDASFGRDVRPLRFPSLTPDPDKEALRMS